MFLAEKPKADRRRVSDNKGKAADTCTVSEAAGEPRVSRNDGGHKVRHGRGEKGLTDLERRMTSLAALVPWAYVLVLVPVPVFCTKLFRLSHTHFPSDC